MEPVGSDSSLPYRSGCKEEAKSHVSVHSQSPPDPDLLLLTGDISSAPDSKVLFFHILFESNLYSNYLFLF